MPDDLFKFDQLAFHLRRLAVGMDWVVGQDYPHEHFAQFAGQTYQSVLIGNPRIQLVPPKRKIEPIDLEKFGQDNLWVAWNFEYVEFDNNTDVRGPSTIAPRLGPAENVQLVHVYKQLAKLTRGQVDPILADGVRWMVDAVKLPRGDEKAFRALL